MAQRFSLSTTGTPPSRRASMVHARLDEPEVVAEHQQDEERDRERDAKRESLYCPRGLATVPDQVDEGRSERDEDGGDERQDDDLLHAERQCEG